MKTSQIKLLDDFIISEIFKFLCIMERTSKSVYNVSTALTVFSFFTGALGLVGIIVSLTNYLDFIFIIVGIVVLLNSIFLTLFAILVKGFAVIVEKTESEVDYEELANEELYVGNKRKAIDILKREKYRISRQINVVKSNYGNTDNLTIKLKELALKIENLEKEFSHDQPEKKED